MLGFLLCMCEMSTYDRKKKDDGHDVSKRFHDLDKNITRCERETKNFKEERCVMIRTRSPFLSLCFVKLVLSKLKSSFIHHIHVVVDKTSHNKNDALLL